ncbi:MAG: ferrochelatase, partial [Nitrospinaceae bacterium]|nr:ferrochelatase [Nitrospinaceae bacterium]NIS87992.1 ferrochelatase [Nitrospinaceae bacterium]
MPGSSPKPFEGPTAIFLMAHGAPTRVDDIPEYLKNIRGGTESSPEVIQMIRERYEAIGGRSPLLEITQAQAQALEKFLNQGREEFKVYFGMRNWSPYIRDGVRQMKADGVRRVLAICLAPQYSKWSTERYFNAFQQALREVAVPDLEVRLISSWANQPRLIDALAEKYHQALDRLPPKGRDRVYTVFTVHSIPAGSVEEDGDPYPEEYEKTVRELVARVRPYRWFRAYQSQGMIPVPWLGPSVESVLDKIGRYGRRTVLVVPVGFVSDHIEV